MKGSIVHSQGPINTFTTEIFFVEKFFIRKSVICTFSLIHTLGWEFGQTSYA